VYVYEYEYNENVESSIYNLAPQNLYLIL